MVNGMRVHPSLTGNPCHREGGNRTGSILKAGLHLGPDCELWAIRPVSMETTYQLENQAPRRKSPRALHHLQEYPNYLCNRIESYILLCSLGYDHKLLINVHCYLPRLKAYESWVNFDCIFLFPLFRLVSGNLGYIKFSQKLVGVFA